jgi:hypothetical protein
MPLRLEVTFADDHVFFPAGHISRVGGSFDGALPVAAIRDADPATAPPEIRTLSGETLFVSAVQREELERFCRASHVPVRRRPDIWGDLLEPFIDTQFTPEDQAATQGRLRRTGLTAAEVDQIRARVGPLMLAYNCLHWDWCHLGLADLLDAATATWLPGQLRAELGEITSLYAWAMKIANGASA